MNKKSMAKNHMSELANKGRYGDDILVHMNRDEAKSLAKSVGLESLPINPKTGFQEAWIFAAGALALGAYAAWKGGSSASTQAGSQAKLTSQQLDEINKAETNLLPSKEAKIDVALLEYEQEGSKVGINKVEAKRSLDTAMNKSGLVSSSGVSENASAMWKQFETQETGLNSQLGKNMAFIEEEYETEKSKLDMESKRLKLQENQFQKESNSWYLGKNLFGKV